MVIYIIGMIQVSDKTYIILGIVYGAVAIILIVVVLVLINKHNKKQYEEILSKLERNKNLIISGNILTELNKVSSLINNKELEKKYESWQKRYKQIKDVDIPSLTNELNDLDELITIKNGKINLVKVHIFALCFSLFSLLKNSLHSSLVPLTKILNSSIKPPFFEI